MGGERSICLILTHQNGGEQSSFPYQKRVEILPAFAKHLSAWHWNVLWAFTLVCLLWWSISQHAQIMLLLIDINLRAAFLLRSSRCCWFYSKSATTGLKLIIHFLVVCYGVCWVHCRLRHPLPARCWMFWRLSTYLIISAFGRVVGFYSKTAHQT